MSYLFYPQIEPYPTTYVSHTYAEKGHHLHHIPFPYLAHKAHRAVHDKDLDVHQSHADVRETLKNFYIEVELPGVGDKSQLHIRWTTTRTLLLSTKTARPEIPEEELFDVSVPQPEQSAPAEKNNSEEATNNKNTPAAPKPALAGRKEPHLTVHERQIGDILRAFNFPVDVDRDNTHAKLDAGLLTIIVPKLEHQQADHLPVNVKVPRESLQKEPLAETKE